MADEAVRIEVTGRIDGKIARSIRDIAKAALEADTNLDLLRNAIQGFNAGSAIKQASNDTRLLRSEITKATQNQRQLTTAVKGTTTGLTAAATAATRYGAALRSANTSTNSLLVSSNNLRGVISTVAGLFGGVFAIGYYARAQDALTSLQNKLRSLTPDLERQAFLQQELFRLANLTRSSVEGTTDGFVRFSRALQGASDTEVLRFTETLNKLLISAGRSTQEVSAVVIQLGQALTSGRLQGDEFRSLSENLPREALQAFADQLGVGVDELKALSSQGKITAEVIRNAFGELADYADNQFARTIPTITQALAVLNNQFIAFTESSSGAAALLAQFIIMIGDNLNTIIPIIAALAAAWAAVKIAAIIIEVASLARTIITLAIAFTAANAITIIWLGVIVLVGSALLSLAYAVAVMTGNADNFEKAIADSITKVKDWASSLFGMSESAEQGSTATNKLQAAAEEASVGINKAQASMEGLTEATNDNTVAVADWAKKTQNHVNAVASSYADLSGAAKEALKAGAQAQYASLSANGPSGSQIAVGRPTGGNTITTLQRPPAFDTGGSMTVSGRSGVDKNLVSFRASNGERVDVKTAAQQRAEDRARRRGDDPPPAGAPTYIFNIETPDADSFRLSKQQISSSIYGATG